MNFFKWLGVVWNLRKTLDQYLPLINKMSLVLDILQEQIADLRATKFQLEKDIAALKKEKESTKDKPLQTKENPAIIIDKHYDPQRGVEYVVTEINGEKVSPDDDTVVE